MTTHYCMILVHHSTIIVRTIVRIRQVFPSNLMYGRNTGNLATIRIRQEFVLREFELSGMHCICIYIFVCVCVLWFFFYSVSLLLLSDFVSNLLYSVL